MKYSHLTYYKKIFKIDDILKEYIIYSLKISIEIEIYFASFNFKILNLFVEREKLLRYYMPRLFSVIFWTTFSICSFTGWKHLAALNPVDSPIWQQYDLPSLITGGLLLFTVLVVGLAVSYIFVLSGHKTERLKSVLIWSLILGLSAIFAYPLGSPDLFGNAAYAHLHAYYGLNPYSSTLTDVNGYLSDPFLKNMVYTDLTTPYGPLWTWLSCGLYKILDGFGFIPLLFGFKFIGLITHLLITLTIYHLAEAVKNGSGSRAAIIYGTNPLAVFDLVVNAHNDGPAILLFTASMYFLIRGYRYIWPLAAGLAASFKLTPLIAFPFMFWKVLHEKNKHIAVLNACSTLVIIAFCYYPFLKGENLLAGFKTTTYGNMANSLPLLLQGMGLPLTIYKIGFIVFILLYAYFLLKTSKKPWNGLLVSIGAGFIIYYLLGAIVVHQWYFLWPLAILSPVHDSHWNKIIIYQTIILFISYIFKVAFWGKTLLFGYCTYLMGWVPILLIVLFMLYKRKPIAQQ